MTQPKLAEIELQPLAIGVCCDHVRKFILKFLSQSDMAIFYVRPDVGVGIGHTTHEMEQILHKLTQADMDEIALSNGSCEGCTAFVECLEKAGEFEQSMDRVKK